MRRFCSREDSSIGSCLQGAVRGLRAGPAEEGTNLRTRCRRLSQMARDASPLMKGDAHRIKAIHVLCQSVANTLGFGLESSEQLVPNDERAAVVAVDVLG